MTEFIQVQTPHEAIQIGFTDQKVSGHAGLATFCGFLHWHRFGALLAQLLPHVRTSKRAIAPADLALGFITGILAGAKKLAHVAHLRRDVMLVPLLAIARIGSQSTFTRFFQGFAGPGQNLATFRPLWRWGMERLPSRPGGYSLDLDSTRLLHEDGHQARSHGAATCNRRFFLHRLAIAFTPDRPPLAHLCERRRLLPALVRPEPRKMIPAARPSCRSVGEFSPSSAVAGFGLTPSRRRVIARLPPGPGCQPCVGQAK